MRLVKVRVVLTVGVAGPCANSAAFLDNDGDQVAAKKADCEDKGHFLAHRGILKIIYQH